MLERNLLYNKTIELTFDPVKHHYKIGEHTTDKDVKIGETVDGATSILKVIDKPALLGWAVNQACEYIDKSLEIGKPLDEIQKMNLIEGARGAYRKHSKGAADIGTLAHAHIEKYILAKLGKGEMPTDPTNEMLLAIFKNFQEWEKKRNVIFKSCERKVYSKKYGVAGTLDLTCEIDGKNVLGDLKTSTGIWQEYWLQTAFYKQAIQEEFPDLHISHTAIIRLGKDGSFEVKELNDFDKNIKAFVGALDLYRRLKEMKHLEFINK